MKRRTFVRHAAVTAAATVGGASLGIDRLGAAPSRMPVGFGSPDRPARADLVLRRATIYDGSGAAPVTGDVAVAGGRITAMADRLTTVGAEELDLAGLALSPGFVDIHSHTGMGLLRDHRADSKVRQGVTTEVAGQDGSSIGWTAEQVQEVRENYRRDGIDMDFSDVGGFLRWIDSHGASVNMASMIGAGTVRGMVIGMTDRRATEDELQRMQALIRVALGAGACGISTGLEYTPGAFADTAELEALASTLRGTGLPLASHMRNEDDRLTAAIEEIIGVGQRVGVPVQISHLKAQGGRNWWKTEPALRMISDARASDIDVMFDVYPYIAYSTGLTNLFPVWAREGGTAAFLRRLDYPTDAPRIEAAVRDKIAMLGSWDAVQMTAAGGADYGWVGGRRLGALAGERGAEPYALLLDITRGDRARTRMVGFGMDEDNVARKLAHPLAMVCSDGGAVTRADGTPHPRNYGTFPRVLGRFCRELRALSLEDAVMKMTSVPARRLRFTDRGSIAVGAAADLVVFDPATVADRATFEQPHQFPVGMPHVIVNGTFVVRDGDHTDARPGRAVRPATG